jgi:hypothetical protein
VVIPVYSYPTAFLDSGLDDDREGTMVDRVLSIELMAPPHDTCIPGLTGVNSSHIKYLASLPINDESNPATPPVASGGIQENIKGQI